MSRSSPAALLLVVLLVGCTTPKKDDWWNHPDRYEQCLAAIGSSSSPDEAVAMREAELNARAQLAATVRSHVRSLTTSWTRRTGWGEAFASWVTRQQWVEQSTRATLAGSWPARYERDGPTLYCLVVVRDPDVLYDSFLDSAVANLDEAPTGGAPGDGAAALQLAVREQQQALAERRAKYLQ